MKHLTYAIFGSLSLIACSVLASAQEVAPTVVVNSKDKDAVRIYRRYDKSKNETITETRYMPIFENNLGGFDMNVFYTYPGKSPTPPQWVTINFISVDPEHEYRRDLIVTADGERYHLGVMEYRKIPDSNSRLGLNGKLTLSIPVAAFQRIANARGVQMKLGTVDFNLDGRHQRKLYGLLSAMSQ